MDAYINLSVMAKNAGGPKELIEKLSAQGFTKGMVVTGAYIAAIYGAKKGASFLMKKYKTQKVENLAAATADAIANAEERSSFTVEATREMQRGLTLTRGDKFRALTRDDDVIMIEVEGRNDNPFFVSGVQLQQISNFKLDDIDDLRTTRRGDSF
jgi:hypothetical protein